MLSSGPNSEGPYNGFCTEGCPGVSCGCQGSSQPLLRLVGPRSGGPGPPPPSRKTAVHPPLWRAIGRDSRPRPCPATSLGSFFYQLGGLTWEHCGLPSGPLPPDPCPMTSGLSLGEEHKAISPLGAYPLPESLRWSRPKVTIPQAHRHTRETPPLTVPTGPPLAPPSALKAENLPMTFCLVLGTLLVIVSLVLGVQWYRGRTRKGRWVWLGR